jgi:3-oxoacyl-[acyl-carrier protein] reductase
MLRESVPEAVQKALVGQTPLGRLGTPADIADAVAFLASDDSRWITGEVIGANGGLG